MTDTHVFFKIPSTNPYLGRHVNHDPRSRNFTYVPKRPAGAPLLPTRHRRNIPVLDQGRLGSCTGNAGLGTLGTTPYWDGWTALERSDGLIVSWPWDERGAVAIYSEATEIDPYPGEYPPDDTGSDGLSIAKVLRGEDVISGYSHAFGLDQALQALMDFPLMVGSVWTFDMLSPDENGVIAPNGFVCGGHEYVIDEYVSPGVIGDTAMVGGTNSWGTGWGVDGRFYLSIEHFDWLLRHQGDVIVLDPREPVTPDPGPEDPQSPDSVDDTLATAMREWLLAKYGDLY